MEDITRRTPDEIMTADIAVVGGGASGLCAAIEARGRGADVVIIEKRPAIGGNISMTEGMFGNGSELQKEAGIEPVAPADIVEEELIYTNYRCSAALWLDYVNKSAENIRWMMDHGVKYSGVSNYRGVSAFPCFHWWEDRIGSNAAKALSAAAEASGARIRKKTRALDLVMEDGKVTGLWAEDLETGKLIRVDAKAVIICTGGSSANGPLFEKLTGYNASLMEGKMNDNTGDGIEMAFRAGAAQTPSAFLGKMRPVGYPVITQLALGTCFQPLLDVNEEGVRFVAEDLQMKKLTALSNNAMNAQKATYVILDSGNVDMLVRDGIINGFLSFYKGDPVPKLREELDAAADKNNGAVFRADTIRGLAEAAGLPADRLCATVERYNALCAAGKDEDYKKDPEYMFPVEKPPFYAIRQGMEILTTIGAIDVDLDNRVLDKKGDPIPGLYATGVDACKLYKETYNYQMSGGMIGYCVYSGRHAAAHIVENLGK